MECVQTDMLVLVMSAQIMNSREAGAAVIVSAHDVFANCSKERSSRGRHAEKNESVSTGNGHNGTACLRCYVLRDIAVSGLGFKRKLLLSYVK